MLEARSHLIEVMQEEIAMSEGYALELAKISALAGEDSYFVFADAVRNIGRHHRIRALELLGKVAVLSCEKIR